VSDDTETTFPSTTFAGSFNGCSSISADFSGDLKFKVSDVPNVLRDLHRLGSGPFDLTIVSRQGQLAEKAGEQHLADLLNDGDDPVAAGQERRADALRPLVAAVAGQNGLGQLVQVAVAHVVHERLRTVVPADRPADRRDIVDEPPPRGEGPASSAGCHVHALLSFA